VGRWGAPSRIREGGGGGRKVKNIRRGERRKGSHHYICSLKDEIGLIILGFQKRGRQECAGTVGKGGGGGGRGGFDTCWEPEKVQKGRGEGSGSARLEKASRQQGIKKGDWDKEGDGGGRRRFGGRGTSHWGKKGNPVNCVKRVEKKRCQ